MGKKSGPKMPKAPDPAATAKAQGEWDIKTAIANANLNRINQYGPQGSIEYKINGYNPDGTPIYSQHETYSPEQQRQYENEMAIANNLSGVANAQLGRVGETMGREFNYNNMTPLQTSVNGQPIQYNIGDSGPIQKSLDYSGAPQLPGVNDFSADAQRVNDAVYKQAMSRLDPAIEQQQRQLATQLAGKGISENSEAYRRAMDQMTRQQTDARNQAMYSGIQAGAQEQSRLFGLGLQARQQAVGETTTQGEFANAAQGQQYTQDLGRGSFYNTAQNQGFQQGMQNANLNNQGRVQQIEEANYLRNLPLQDIAALLQTGGGVQNPDFEDYANVSMPGVDYAGLVQNNYNAQMQQYNAKQQARSSALGSVFGLGGKLLGGFLSDRRLKENLKRIGKTSKGIPTYTFNYIGSRFKEFGVMAQEVIKVIPEAIGFKGGYMTVDYGKVW